MRPSIYTFCKQIITLLFLLGISIIGLQAQTFPTPTGFTLPPGKSICITYDVTVNTNACPTGTVPMMFISNQSNVTGSNFSMVQTDDPDIGGASDPTTTMIASITLGNLVFEDVNNDGMFNGMDIGLDNVALNLYADDGDGVLDAGDGAAIANTMTAGGGLYVFNVCPGNYIVEIEASNFMMGGILYNSGAPYLSVTSVVNPDNTTGAPDTDVDNDDNGDPVMGFGVASSAIRLDFGDEPGNSDINNTLDFALRKPTSVTISDLMMSEGSGGGTVDFNFVVTRSSDDEAFSLIVNTTGGTATSGTDFTAITNGMISFAANDNILMKNVTVTVNKDDIVELDEMFTVTISGAPMGVIITDGTADGTIEDDDNATVSVNSVSQSEATSPFQFTVSLSKAVDVDVSVAFSTSDGTATDVDNDYESISPNPKTIIIPAGMTSQMVDIIVNNDMKVESDEQFNVSIDNLMNGGRAVVLGTAAGTGTIENDDVAAISIAATTNAMEDATNGAFTISTDKQFDAPVTINFSVAGSAIAGTDYTSLGASVVFPANTSSISFPVMVMLDNLVEATETVILTLTSTNNADVGIASSPDNQATVNIQDNDAAVVALMANVTQAEATSPQVFTVTLSNPVDVDVTVNFSTSDNTATTGDNDYTGITNQLVTFMAGTTTAQVVNVIILDDNKVEANEVFDVTLSGLNNNGRSMVTLGTAMGTGTIENDEIDFGDAPTAAQSSFANSYPTTLGGNGARHNTIFGFSLGATIDGETDGQPTATANGDGADEDGVTLPPALITGTNANLTVNLTNAASIVSPKFDAWVDFNADGDFSDMGEQIFTNQALVAGNNNLFFAVPMGAMVGTSFARFRLSSAGGLLFDGAAADGEVEDYQVTILDNQYSISSPMVMEGNSGMVDLTFVVSRTSTTNAGSVDYTIDLIGGSATAGTDYVTPGMTSGTILFAMGENDKPITIQVNGDTEVELDETILVNLSNPMGGGIGAMGQGTGTIMNDDTEVNVAVSPGSVAENSGLPMTYTFTRVGVLTNDLVVNFDLSGSATLVTDYMLSGATLVSGSSYTVTIPMNMTSADVTVTPVGDNTVELDETVAMTITASMDYNVGMTNVASGTITNDDVATVSVVGTSVNEDAGPLNFSVTLSNPVDVDVTVQFSTSDGTATDADNDYEPITNQTVTFLAGTTTAQSVPVTINDDNKVETDETFNGNINMLSAGGRNVSIMTNSATGTILNNTDMATVHLTAVNVSQNEGHVGTTDFTFRAELDNPVQGGFKLAYTTDDGTATTADLDYQDNDGMLMFNGTAGEFYIITVKVNGDTKVEADETFSVSIEDTGFSDADVALSNLKTASTVGATILNDDIATLSIDNVSLAEGISGTTTFTFTITLDNPVQGGFSIDYATLAGILNPASAGTDYTAVAATTLNFAGTMDESMMVSVNVAGDCDVEMDETFLLALSNLVLNDMNIDPADINITDQGLGTILNDDASYPGGIIYVDASAVSANNGSDWTNAFTKLQDALRIACTCGNASQIWVADGTYYPDEGIGQTDNDRTASFALCNNVALYGGFAGMPGTEGDFSVRDIAIHLTVLSGDIDQNDSQTPVVTDVNTVTGTTTNALHVVTGSSNNSATILDGFIITAGRADIMGFPDGVGGGMYVENTFATVRNCTFAGNYARTAGSIYINTGVLMIVQCTFTGNKAMFDGGAIFSDGNGGPIVNCIFIANEAGANGGALYTTSSGNLSAVNTVFSGNKAGATGGAVYNDNSSPDFFNCSFSGNNAVTNGGAFSNNVFSSPTITNSILWGNSSEIFNDGNNTNPVVNYSIVQGGHAGTDNKNMNPMFVSQPAFASAPTTSGDLRLQITSPAIDMGDDASVSADTKDVDDDGDTAEPTPDRDLNNRIVGTSVDMGAYEFPCASEAGEIANEDLTICQGDDPETIFTASGAQNDAEYSFAFILTSGNDILAYNIDGDFDLSALTPGTYTVYGLSYATFNTPASVTDYLATVTTIAEIIADDTDNGGELCLDLTDAGEGQTASIIVNEPATASLIDAYPTICRTKVVQLSELEGAIGGSATSATWSVLEGDSDGVFSPSNVFGTATTFKPGANDAKRGYVTIVLKTNDPDGPDGPCPPAMDTIRIIVKNVDCGTFPWNGNE